MALVPQDHFLYRGKSLQYSPLHNTITSPGTIRENLCLGVKRSILDAELQEACKAAAIHDFILSLPEG
jgi:ABC-type multidrug transport system fused ATPase/permease subunit